jgi:citrate synthase
MSTKATLSLPEKTVELPIVIGSEGEKAIDIGELRNETGYISIDPAYMNTGSCCSNITFIDGDRGILRYRGFPVDILAEKSAFLETSYLLLFGELPNKKQLDKFAADITHHRLLDEDLKHIFRAFRRDGHPMAMLGSVLFGLSAKYDQEKGNPKDLWYLNTVRLMAKIPTAIAFAHRRGMGQPFVYPQDALPYCENFLHIMFSLPTQRYEVSPELLRALELLLVVHADHEQNCSTSAVRMARSSMCNIFTCIAAGIGALWGSRHGGANQEVIEMLERIRAEGADVKHFIDQVKDKRNKILLMGFGHRVYKNFDPRARIIKKACDDLLHKLNRTDPLLDIAKHLEDAALHDPYFVERKLYPNVDFYSGIMYRAMGIPVTTFPAMFAMGRLPGWLAQLKEFNEDPQNKISRPRQIYTGPTAREYVPIEQR